jgi:hypothetical protein
MQPMKAGAAGHTATPAGFPNPLPCRFESFLAFPVEPDRSFPYGSPSLIASKNRLTFSYHFHTLYPPYSYPSHTPKAAFPV